MAFEGIPAVLRHVTLAVFKKLRGDDEHRFKEAFTIARAQLAKYGYLVPESETGSVEHIKLTAKGLKRDQKHLREGSKGRLKDLRFMELYRASELYLTEEPKGGSASEEPR